MNIVLIFSNLLFLYNAHRSSQEWRLRIDTPTQVCQTSSPKRRIRVILQAIYMSLADCRAIDAYVISISTLLL